MQALNSCTELSPSEHTHFHRESNTLNSIDKIFACLSSSIFTCIRVSVKVERSPVMMSDLRLSSLGSPPPELFVRLCDISNLSLNTSSPLTGSSILSRQDFECLKVVVTVFPIGINYMCGMPE